MCMYILEAWKTNWRGEGDWKEVGHDWNEQNALNHAKIIAGLDYCDVRITKRTIEVIGIMKGSK